LFAGRGGETRGLTTRQYARLVGEWFGSIGLDPLKFGTHSLRRYSESLIMPSDSSMAAIDWQSRPNLLGIHRRRTKATIIYRRTGNLRADQLLLGHTKIESTVRYLGIEIDDAIEIAEKIDV
jgi:hypothetical protein